MISKGPDSTQYFVDEDGGQDDPAHARMMPYTQPAAGAPARHHQGHMECGGGDVFARPAARVVCHAAAVRRTARR